MVNTKGSKKSIDWKKLIRLVLLVLVLATYFYFEYIYIPKDDVANSNENIISTTEESSSSSSIVSDGDILTVYMWDVGQGDSTLFVQGDTKLLIDCGSSDSNDTLIHDLQNIGIEDIDYFIGTHPHEDHMGELYDVLSNFTIKNIYIPYTPNVTTKYYTKALELAKSQNISFYSPTVGDTLNIGKATVLFLAPSSEKYSNTNNYSIATKISFGDIDFLFTGDAETLAEDEIIATGYDLDCEIMKAGHHGSDTSNSDELLDAVTPDIVLISAGVGNTYDHPIESILNKYQERGITIFRTDECGDIIITTDGKSIKFNCEPGDYKTASEVAKEHSK